MCVLLCKQHKISPFAGVAEDTRIGGPVPASVMALTLGVPDETVSMCSLKGSCISTLHTVISSTCNDNNMII